MRRRPSRAVLDGAATVTSIRQPPAERVVLEAETLCGEPTGPLRIGLISPPWVAVPPPAYGGTELTIDVLARGLSRLGHEVMLFATGDSTCEVTLGWHYEKALPPELIGSAAHELAHTTAAYEALAGSCDIIHDATLSGLFVGRLYPGVPVVTTAHGPFVSPLVDLYRAATPAVGLIAISGDQAVSAPDRVLISAVVHHGLDLDRYRYTPIGGDYFACLGRMSPDKGIDTSIAVARRAGVPLKIAAKMREQPERDYFAGVIEPLLGGDIEYVGEVGHTAKIDLLAGAAGLVNPIRWPEPFGLVMIEALACGTPVIATPCGAAPELVTNNVTGYLATTTGDLARAVNASSDIKRAACRQDAELRFSMKRMALDHVSVYRRLIARHRAAPITCLARPRT